MKKLRVFKRLKILEWQVEMLLAKIASVGGDPMPEEHVQELLKRMPKELRNKK